METIYAVSTFYVSMNLSKTTSLLFVFLCLLAAAFTQPSVSFAEQTTQENTPWGQFEDITASLFEAQKEMLFDDPEAAAAAIDLANEQLNQFLATYPDFPAEAEQAARDALDFAAVAITENNGNKVSAAKGKLRTALLLGSFQLTKSNIDSGDYEAAREWLLVRDFRPSTRFDRPGADATLAVTELVEGTTTPDKAWPKIEADLLDTYQGKLVETLGMSGDDSLFPNRRSESAGLAAGYWLLLEPAFRAQTGDVATDE
ncbi:MAG: hypothetical protein AAF902_21790, partial [Chloroflexota bacterium]